MDWEIYIKAQQVKPYAKAPAKLSGGDMPGRNVDCWLNDELTVLDNPTYKSSEKSVTVCGEIEK